MLLELLTDDVLRDPYPLYAELRRHSPVLHAPVLHTAGSTMQAVFDHAGVRRVLTDTRSFGSAVVSGRPAKWLVFLDPPRHGTLRALVSRAFTARAITSLEARIATLSRRLLDDAAPRGEMDLVADYAARLPLMVIAELLGTPADDWERLRRWSDATLALASTLQGGEAAERAEREFRVADEEMAEHCGRLARARRESPRDDILSALVHAEVEGSRLDDGEILGFFQLLLLAGHETTTTLISIAVLCLLEHPRAHAALRASPGRAADVVEEVLRYRAPVQTAFRIARTDVDLGGTTIPRGATVLAFIGSANRDPDQHADPDRFDIDREAAPHLAFGHGAHFCLGAQLARLEGRIALADLVTRFPDLRRAEDGPWEPRRAFHVHGPTRLPLRFSQEAGSTRELL